MLCIVDVKFRNLCILKNIDKDVVLKLFILIDYKVYKIVFNLVCRDI